MDGSTPTHILAALTQWVKKRMREVDQEEWWESMEELEGRCGGVIDHMVRGMYMKFSNNNKGDLKR